MPAPDHKKDEETLSQMLVKGKQQKITKGVLTATAGRPQMTTVTNANPVSFE
jgi:hypothetical protein